MTLGEDYPKQQERCRKILGYAQELQPQEGFFLIAVLKDLLKRADQAAISGDVVEMIRVYQEMKDVQE